VTLFVVVYTNVVLLLHFVSSVFSVGHKSQYLSPATEHLKAFLRFDYESPRERDTGEPSGID
jgi:hypothetical protein